MYVCALGVCDLLCKYIDCFGCYALCGGSFVCFRVRMLISHLTRHGDRQIGDATGSVILSDGTTDVADLLAAHLGMQRVGYACAVCELCESCVIHVCR